MEHGWMGVDLECMFLGDLPHPGPVPRLIFGAHGGTHVLRLPLHAAVSLPATVCFLQALVKSAAHHSHHSNTNVIHATMGELS